MVRASAIQRGDVHLVGLDPMRGPEMKMTRPCVIVSPDELNAHLLTVIVVPLSTAEKSYPFRVRCRFEDREGLVVLDQIRTIDRDRLLRRLGRLSPSALENVLATLREMFES